MMHVFTDASRNSRTKQCAGAYVLGRHGKVWCVSLAGPTAMHAELQTMIAALSAVWLRQMRGALDEAVIVHTDLAHIERILETRKDATRTQLHQLVSDTKAQLRTDARNYREYHLCHQHARIKAGVFRALNPDLKWRARQASDYELKGGLG